MQKCNPCRTYVDTQSKLGADGVPISDPTLCQSLAVQQDCLYMPDPWEPDLAALKRILRYVCGTIDHVLQLHVSENLLSWPAKRKVTLSRSSVEAEYRSVADVVAETAWVRNLLHELHAPLLITTLVYCDNVSVVYLSTNPVQHQHTKHIEIDIHFVHDFVASGQVCVLHVPLQFQLLISLPKAF
ncbi:ribonuclease H-like domain-containing protein [Tanacetum coccineum]